MNKEKLDEYFQVKRYYKELNKEVHSLVSKFIVKYLNLNPCMKKVEEIKRDSIHDCDTKQNTLYYSINECFLGECDLIENQLKVDDIDILFKDDETQIEYIIKMLVPECEKELKEVEETTKWLEENYKDDTGSIGDNLNKKADNIREFIKKYKE